jgi:hypothetical protein
MSMQNDQPLQAGPTAPLRVANDGSKRGCGRYILIACGVLVVLAFFIAGLIAAIMHFGGKSVEPYVATYFDHVNRGEYAAIYDEAHPKLQEITTKDEFVQLLQGVHDKLGEYKSKSLNGINIKTENGVSTAVATYDATFAKGEAEVKLDFFGEGEAWKLAGVNYKSLLLP